MHFHTPSVPVTFLPHFQWHGHAGLDVFAPYSVVRIISHAKASMRPAGLGHPSIDTLSSMGNSGASIVLFQTLRLEPNDFPPQSTIHRIELASTPWLFEVINFNMFSCGLGVIASLMSSSAVMSLARCSYNRAFWMAMAAESANVVNRIPSRSRKRLPSRLSVFQ